MWEATPVAELGGLHRRRESPPTWANHMGEPPDIAVRRITSAARHAGEAGSAWCKAGGGA
jgi:hypothetical protein